MSEGWYEMAQAIPYIVASVAPMIVDYVIKKIEERGKQKQEYGGKEVIEVEIKKMLSKIPVGILMRIKEDIEELSKQGLSKDNIVRELMMRYQDIQEVIGGIIWLEGIEGIKEKLEEIRKRYREVVMDIEEINYGFSELVREHTREEVKSHIKLVEYLSKVL
ncbi:MAG: hypothetical protein QW052_06225 [Candidatus Nitrosocaldaceae archaeon]